MQYWDILRKKYVTATAEEKVRQWFISYLKDALGVPEHLMMSEWGFRFGQKQYRADIIIYDRNAKPLAVVECKRDNVELTQEVAEQALRYNSVLNVRYIFLTNGKTTYLYALKNSVFVPCERIPNYEEMLCQQ